MNNCPKVSVFTASKNGARFLRDTIESILNQTFADYEHVIADGASTDGTVEILSQYPHIRWVSEPDASATEGFHKAIAMCRGEYLFQCCVSDGFLDRNWFQTCVDILDSNPDISLVYGFPQYMTEEGNLWQISYNEFFTDPPPQKEEFLPFWLATRFIFPEGNYCVRKDVFLDCFPPADSGDFFDRINPFLKFVYNFNTKGYLPFFVPIIANYGRIHKNQLTERLAKEAAETIRLYLEILKNYEQALFKGDTRHLFRDGNGGFLREMDASEINVCRRMVKIYALSRTIYFSRGPLLRDLVMNRIRLMLLDIGRRD